MNTDLQELDRFSARKAAVKYARVVSRNPDGTYNVSNIATGEVRRVSRANPAEEYTTGSWVLVGSTNATGATIGSSDMILSRAPNEQRGTSATTPNHTSATVGDGAAVFSVMPNPIELVAGGAAVGATIYGIGFLATPPTYANAGITNDTPPSIAPTRIDISIKAGGAVTPGPYDLSVGAAVAAAAIRVVEGVVVAPSFSVVPFPVAMALGDVATATLTPIGAPFVVVEAGTIAVSMGSGVVVGTGTRFTLYHVGQSLQMSAIVGMGGFTFASFAAISSDTHAVLNFYGVSAGGAPLDAAALAFAVAPRYGDVDWNLYDSNWPTTFTPDQIDIAIEAKGAVFGGVAGTFAITIADGRTLLGAIVVA